LRLTTRPPHGTNSPIQCAQMAPSSAYPPLTQLSVSAAERERTIPAVGYAQANEATHMRMSRRATATLRVRVCAMGQAAHPRSLRNCTPPSSF